MSNNYMVSQLINDELEIVIQNDGRYRLQTKFNANIVVWVSELLDIYTKDAQQLFKEMNFACEIEDGGRKIYADDIEYIYEVKNWVESLMVADKLKGAK